MPLEPMLPSVRRDALIVEVMRQIFVEDGNRVWARPVTLDIGSWAFRVDGHFVVNADQAAALLSLAKEIGVEL